MQQAPTHFDVKIPCDQSTKETCEHFPSVEIPIPKVANALHVAFSPIQEQPKLDLRLVIRSPHDTNAEPLAHQIDRSMRGKVSAPQYRNGHQGLNNVCNPYNASKQLIALRHLCKRTSQCDCNWPNTWSRKSIKCVSNHLAITRLENMQQQCRMWQKRSYVAKTLPCWRSLELLCRTSLDHRTLLSCWCGTPPSDRSASGINKMASLRSCSSYSLCSCFSYGSGIALTIAIACQKETADI